MMQTAFRSLAGLVLTALVVPAPGSAGAWLQDPGTMYARVSYGILQTDTRFDKNGDVIPFNDAGGLRSTEYTDRLTVFYSETGLSRYWTLVAGLAYKSLSASENAAVHNSRGFSNVTAGPKVLLWRDESWVTSVAGLVSLPLGYEAADYPSLGNGEPDFHLSLQGGTANRLFWSNLDAVFSIRGGDYRNQVGGALAGGFSIGPQVRVRGEIKSVTPLGAERESQTPTGLTPFDPGTADARYSEVAATAGFALTGWMAVEVDFRRTFAGENTTRGTRWGVALATSSNIRLWRPAS